MKHQQCNSAHLDRGHIELEVVVAKRGVAGVRAVGYLVAMAG